MTLYLQHILLSKYLNLRMRSSSLRCCLVGSKAHLWALSFLDNMAFCSSVQSAWHDVLIFFFAISLVIIISCFINKAERSDAQHHLSVDLLWASEVWHQRHTNFEMHLGLKRWLHFQECLRLSRGPKFSSQLSLWVTHNHQ